MSAYNQPPKLIMASITDDAIENERHNTIDMVWDVSGYAGPRGEEIDGQVAGCHARLD